MLTSWLGGRAAARARSGARPNGQRCHASL